VHDIEDLTSLGRQQQVCPYYLARSKLSNVDIAVLPYNYLLTPSIRRKLPLKIEDSILIFDEAHNLERTCEEIMSFKLSVEKLMQCDKILQKLEDMYRNQGQMSHVSSGGNTEKAGDKLDDTELLRLFLDTLRKTID
jgi:Rad3-related DNA helicase